MLRTDVARPDPESENLKILWSRFCGQKKTPKKHLKTPKGRGIPFSVRCRAATRRYFFENRMILQFWYYSARKFPKMLPAAGEKIWGFFSVFKISLHFQKENHQLWRRIPQTFPHFFRRFAADYIFSTLSSLCIVTSDYYPPLQRIPQNSHTRRISPGLKTFKILLLWHCTDRIHLWARFIIIFSDPNFRLYEPRVNRKNIYEMWTQNNYQENINMCRIFKDMLENSKVRLPNLVPQCFRHSKWTRRCRRCPRWRSQHLALQFFDSFMFC